jgi:hypothetical protein
MPALTLNQAAKAAKKAKATLLDAIQSGRLSAPKDDQGRYQIDPAELFRVYPLDQSKNHDRPPEEPPETAVLLVTIKHLEQQLDGLQKERERERAILEGQLQREREQADHWRQQATGLLTYQPAANQNQPPRFSFARPWLWVVLIAAVALAGSYALLLKFGGV